MKNICFFIIHSIPVVLLLTACSGGGGIAEGGLEGTGLGVGPVSSFGSIFVNDIEYDTRNADILINDAPADETQLKLGMYVRVTGPHRAETGQGTAQRVEYRDRLRGQISFINANATAVRVLGQLVKITPETHLYGFNTVADLKVGDSLRVSGPSSLRRSEIDATFVEYLPAGTVQAALITSISMVDIAVDTVAQSFFIGGLRVFYDEASSLPEQFQVGDSIQILGRKTNEHALYADSIQILPHDALPAGSLTHIVGSVTRYENPQDFDVEYYPVSLPQALAERLQRLPALGSQVSIKGTFDADGVIIVNELQVYDEIPLSGTPNDLLLRVGGPIENVAPAAGQFKVFGVDCLLQERTRYRDMSGANPTYGMADLRTGDYINVVAQQMDSQGRLMPLEAFHSPFAPADVRQLQGPAGAIDSLNRQLKILGVDVVSAANTRYFDASQMTDLFLPPNGPSVVVPDDTETDAATFFRQLEALPRKLVHANGSVQGNAMQAKNLILLPFELSSSP